MYLLSRSRQYPVTYSEAFFWSIFIIPLLAIVYQISAIFRSLHRIKLSLLAVYIFLPVGISLASIVFYQLNNDLMRVDAAVLLNLGVTILVAWFMIRKLMKRCEAEAQPVATEI